MFNFSICQCIRKPRLIVLLVCLVFSSPLSADKYYQWEALNYSIDKPLGGLTGNLVRGRKLVVQRDKGNCLACHAMPIQEEAFHGTVGPPMHGIASRLTAGQLRFRIINQPGINPLTVMPAFYQDPVNANRISDEYIGKTILTAQEVEDVVTYLMTLKQDVSR